MRTQSTLKIATLSIIGAALVAAGPQDSKEQRHKDRHGPDPKAVTPPPPESPSSSAAIATAPAAEAPVTAPSLAGTYHTIASVVSSSCPNFGSQFEGNLAITQPAPNTLYLALPQLSPTFRDGVFLAVGPDGTLSYSGPVPVNFNFYGGSYGQNASGTFAGGFRNGRYSARAELHATYLYQNCTVSMDFNGAKL